jgi:hypothetical protein
MPVPPRPSLVVFLIQMNPITSLALQYIIVLKFLSYLLLHLDFLTKINPLSNPHTWTCNNHIFQRENSALKMSRSWKYRLMLSIDMLSIEMLSIDMLSIEMLSIGMLSIDMLSIGMLSIDISQKYSSLLFVILFWLVKCHRRFEVTWCLLALQLLSNVTQTVCYFQPSN